MDFVGPLPGTKNMRIHTVERWTPYRAGELEKNGKKKSGCSNIFLQNRNIQTVWEWVGGADRVRPSVFIQYIEELIEA